MKPTPGRVVSAFVLAVAVGLVAVRFTGTAPDTPDRPSAASLQHKTEAERIQARALASYRVHDQVTPEGVQARGENYSADVTRHGLEFKADDFTMTMRAATLTQGGTVLKCAPGTAERTAFGRADIKRGPVIEEYIFENRRVEQLFHIEEPLSVGALTVTIDVETDLLGRVDTVHRLDTLWKDTALWHGGLVFHDAQGNRKLAYHSAIAIDSAGRRQTLEPQYRNGQIHLQVPASFMEEAEFPLTVDPWLELDFSAAGGGISNNPGVSQTPAVAIEGGGNPYIAWADDTIGNFEIYFRYFNGVEWFNLAGSDTGGGISANAGDSVNPSIFLPSNGEVMIAWEDNTSGNLEIYLKKWSNDSVSWVELAGSADGTSGLSGTVGLSQFPAVVGVRSIVPSTAGTPAQESEIVPVVVWEDTSLLGSSEIFGAFYFQGDPGDGFVFLPIPEGWYGLTTQVLGSFDNISGTSFGVSQTPVLTLDTADRPVVAWQDTANGNFEIYMRRFDTGGPWDLTGNLVGSTWAELGAGTSASAGGVSGAFTPGTMSAIEPSIAASQTGTNDIFISYTEVDNLANTQEIRVVSYTGAGAGPTSHGLPSTITADPSILSSVGVGSNNLPIVAWQERLVVPAVPPAPPDINHEIYVMSFDGGAWNEMGLNNTSASRPAADPTIGGISQTFGGSWSPSIAVAGIRGGVVAWQDWADGAFEIYVRRFYENEPTNLNQATLPLIQPSDVLVGQTSINPTIYLRGTPFGEPDRPPPAPPVPLVKMQVEVRPVGSPFVGAPTAESNLIAVSGATGVGVSEVAIPFTGLPNTSYHWQARTIDEVGNTSAWIGFGGNATGTADFSIVAAPPGPPQDPSGLVATGGALQISLTWNAPSGSPSSYDILRSTATGGPYTVIGGSVGTSFVDGGLPQGATFFYVVVANNAAGASGQSNEASATTLVGVSPPSNDKDKCGATGLEALLVIGLAGAALRRRRRRTVR